MKIYESLNDIKNIEPTVVAMGNFDGIHRGHKELIRRCVSAARSAGMKAAVFTFSNHPKNFFKESSVKTLLFYEEKKELVESLGVDYFFNIPFDETICKMSAEEYVDELLIGLFNMQEAYCGFNYRFGNKARGNTEMLMKMSLQKGFGIHVMEPFKVDGQVVSSTLIRECIGNGQMEKARKYLDRYYSVRGEVIHGNEIGRTIGFATANIMPDEIMLTPENGVYATCAMVEGERYPSVTNVGVKPTVGINKRNIETHIFGFNQDIYGSQIKVEFMKLLREEKKFDSLDQLKRQIENDCINAKAFHRKNY